ncbi:hypothetical protein CDAR_213941 [Caerostris darwini]|uniref:Ycf15 n=1 Tax=Caerostris darwini TaxID=1538125 RepID=A0AAV4SIN3_9ARAC|nr:hypothetical protein CDAR_213941 [Caerostris darwini]
MFEGNKNKKIKNSTSERNFLYFYENGKDKKSEKLKSFDAYSKHPALFIDFGAQTRRSISHIWVILCVVSRPSGIHVVQHSMFRSMPGWVVFILIRNGRRSIGFE